VSVFGFVHELSDLLLVPKELHLDRSRSASWNRSTERFQSSGRATHARANGGPQKNRLPTNSAKFVKHLASPAGFEPASPT
jgi:hypothetical protein